MDEVKSIQLQLERLVLTLSHRVQDIYSSLLELENLTQMLFDITPNDPSAIALWLQQEQFEQDEHNYFKSIKKAKQFNEKCLPADAMTYQWSASLKNNAELKFKLFALRNIGKTLKRIKQRLGNVSLIYYQDTLFNISLCFPYFDITTVIPADFNWLAYHSCISVNPENNPKHKIQWAPPNIDYADDGLISIASIPIYRDKTFSGVWSIDVPLSTIHQDCVLDTFVSGQVNFITDYKGNIIIHPIINTEIDKEKGAFYQKNIKSLSLGFNQLNLADLITQEKGVIEIKNEQGEDIFVIYQIIPDIKWLLFGTFSKAVMLESIGNKISNAFEDMKKKELPNKIDFEVGNEMQMLVTSYNDMIEVLAYHQKEREKTLKAQHEELESQVKLRTAELVKLNTKLASLANTDYLTGLINRRHFFEVVKPVLKLLIRQQKPSSLLMIDIDNFKLINDAKGHDIGDLVLQNFANVILNKVRKSDICARYGGEEFLVFLPNTNINEAQILAEVLKQFVENQNVNDTKYTVSIGATQFSEQNIEKTITQADIALYSAKDKGRNRVELYKRKS